MVGLCSIDMIITVASLFPVDVCSDAINVLFGGDQHFGTKDVPKINFLC